MIDAAAPVRPGEELPEAPLAALLAARLGLSGPLAVEQFTGGYSNLTYLLRMGGRELVLRRPPRGAAAKGGHDMAREHRVLLALSGRSALVPRPLLVCEDDAVIGAPFFVMERVRGVILRDGPRFAATELPPDAMRRLSLLLADTLAALHGIDATAPEVRALGRPEGYLARQVRGWAERYQKARTDDVPGLESAARWLQAEQPPDRAPALVHNDFKYDNLVLSEDLSRVVAVLDWEMATLGDPLLDLGTTLAYWADPLDPEAWRDSGFLTLTLRPGNLSRAELVARYAQASGRDIGAAAAVFGYVFGLFKLAVIAQQIYARYRGGLTRDPRFARLGAVVRGCAEQAGRAIERGRIDRLGD